MLQSTIYISNVSEGFSENDIEHISSCSHLNNSKHKITGFLYFNRSQFLQYIEGPSNSLHRLIQNIVKDNRHKITFQLHNPTVIQRKFPDWQLKIFRYSRVNDQNNEQLLMNLMQFINSITCSKENQTAAIDRMLQRIVAANIS